MWELGRWRRYTSDIRSQYLRARQFSLLDVKCRARRKLKAVLSSFWHITSPVQHKSQCWYEKFSMMLNYQCLHCKTSLMLLTCIPKVPSSNFDKDNGYLPWGPFWRPSVSPGKLRNKRPRTPPSTSFPVH